MTAKAKRNLPVAAKAVKRKGNANKKKITTIRKEKSNKTNEVHYGGYGIHGPVQWNRAVIKGYISKIDKTELVRDSDTRVFRRSGDHGRTRVVSKFTASAAPTELLFASAVYLVGLYQSHMIHEILKELFTGQTGKTLRSFAKTKIFNSFNRPIRYEYRILVPDSRVTLSVLIQGSDSIDFEKSLALLSSTEQLAKSWCAANIPQDCYVTFQIKDGVVAPAPYITNKPV